MVVLSPLQEAGAAKLHGLIPGVRIDIDEVVGSPAWVMSPAGFLSGPANKEEITPKMAQAVPKPGEDDPLRPIKRFLNENSALFGHGAEALTNAGIKDDFVTPHNGMRSVVWEQQVDGIPLYGGLLVGHLTRNGELVNLSSRFLPNVQAAAQMDAAQRVALIEGLGWVPATPVPGVGESFWILTGSAGAWNRTFTVW